MHSPARPLDVDDDGMMDYTVDDGGGDHGIPQVIAELLKINVRSDERAPLAVPAIDDLEEEGGVPRVLLFQPVEAEFVDKCYAPHLSTNVERSLMLRTACISPT